MNPVLYVIDAFADRAFTGNPAAVCIMQDVRDNYWMQQLAAEMNLSETAFVTPREDAWSLRWFTPLTEVDLCGHATLASAHALWETGTAPAGEPLEFHTRSGVLICRKSDTGIVMDFPAVRAESCAAPDGISAALGCPVVAAAFNGMDYLIEVPSAKAVREVQPHFAELARLPARGVIVTARSDDPEFDFVSRFFGPAVGVNEDPVTGSAHCALGPYWAERLGKRALKAWQASARGGRVGISLQDDRVFLTGTAVTVSRVELTAAAAAP